MANYEHMCLAIAVEIISARAGGGGGGGGGGGAAATPSKEQAGPTKMDLVDEEIMKELVEHWSQASTLPRPFYFQSARGDETLDFSLSAASFNTSSNSSHLAATSPQQVLLLSSAIAQDISRRKLDLDKRRVDLLADLKSVSHFSFPY